MHVELKFLAYRLNVLQTFLIIRTGTTDPDLDFVLVECRGELP